METQTDAELRFHMEAYAEDLIHSGVPSEEALRRARLQFGGVERAKEECREARGVNLVESLIQDLRYGTGNMLRTPGFTAITVRRIGRRVQRACLGRHARGSDGSVALRVNRISHAGPQGKKHRSGAEKLVRKVQRKPELGAPASAPLVCDCSREYITA